MKVVAFVSVLAVAAVVAAQQEPASYKSSPYLRVDPDKIVITDATARTPCGDCHTPEWEVWKETKHAKGFETMHKSESAQGILEAMDLRVTKRQEALCMRCHYTVGRERKAIAGVSCESCHGPAANWVNVHNSWETTDRVKETPAARAARVAESRKAGMLRPSTDIYAVAANCFECHTVPIEDLVNRGGHKAGTSGFELVKRVNSIRHNFLDSAGQSSGANREMSRERARLMYVVGRMLAYEYSLRGLAAASAPGAYARSMTTRATDAVKRLDEIASAVTIPAVTQVLRSNTKLQLVPGNRVPLEAAADSVRAIGERFVAANTGSTFAALDRFIAGAPAQLAGRPDPTPAAARDPAESRPAANPPPAATPGGGTVPGVAAATKTVPPPATPAVSPTAAAAVPGAIRNRPAWHTTEYKSNVTEAGECAGCHSVAEAKLTDSKHQQAAQRLTGESPKARRIAELYGIGAAAMARPDRLCMSCHATVDDATKTVHETGVTCEACHGAGAAYKDTHRKAGGSKDGMRPLKRADVRARLCSDCHWISDERLLAAGHPDGSKKDFVKANKDIEHWPDPKATRGRGKDVPYPAVADEALRTAIAAITAARAIPRVSVVGPQPRVAQREPPAAAGPQAPAAGPQATEQVPVRPPRQPVATSAQSSIPPSVPTALPRRVTRDNVSLQLEPVPPTEGMTIEELMLLIKQRTALIHTAIRRANQ